uniref:Uncharacterized protein n=1 Tax=Timema poppense TaxID=170557 RepID=A0A7R9DX56_TIMPO|nr:unnamed protein product [Timema poppensis]
MLVSLHSLRSSTHRVAHVGESTHSLRSSIHRVAHVGESTLSLRSSTHRVAHVGESTHSLRSSIHRAAHVGESTRSLRSSTHRAAHVGESTRSLRSSTHRAAHVGESTRRPGGTEALTEDEDKWWLQYSDQEEGEDVESSRSGQPLIYQRSPDGGAFLSAQPVPRCGAFCYLAVVARAQEE